MTPEGMNFDAWLEDLGVTEQPGMSWYIELPN